MKIKTIMKIVNGVGNVSGSINKIKIDSRELNKNDLFIAINGGINYVDEAIKKGCKVICEKKLDRVIYVEDSKKALANIARYIINKYKCPVIAITGSNGKTTTKELIYSVLSKKYNVLKNNKNKNNYIGLPETILDLNELYDICVLEIGMNNLGEIGYLSNIIKPDYAIITNIGSAHIGNLGSKKNILKAKLEISAHSKKLIVNGNDKYLKKISSDRVYLKELKNIKYYSDRTEFDFNGSHFIFNIPGKHLLIDVLFAIKIGLIYGVEINDINDAIFAFKPIDGRMNIIRGKYTIIDDSYNANYESVKASLELLKNNDRKIIILGDMLELGKYSKYYHKKINRILKKIKNKEVLLIGDYTKYISGRHFNGIDDLFKYFNKIVKENDIILVKGSNKFKLNILVDKIKTL